MRETNSRNSGSLAAILLAATLTNCAGAGGDETGAQIIPAAAAQTKPVEDRRIEDEIIYFVLPDRFENGDDDNDRGGIDGGRLKDGYDPTDYGFYHASDQSVFQYQRW